MPDLQGNPCNKHFELTCACDELRDKKRGVHRSTTIKVGTQVKCTCEKFSCPKNKS